MMMVVLRRMHLRLRPGRGRRFVMVMVVLGRRWRRIPSVVVASSVSGRIAVVVVVVHAACREHQKQPQQYAKHHFFHGTLLEKKVCVVDIV